MCNFSKHFEQNKHQQQCCIKDGKEFKLFNFQSISSEKTKQLTIKEILPKIHSANTYSVITIYLGKDVFSCEEISLLIDAISNLKNIKTLNLILHFNTLYVECANSLIKLLNSLQGDLEQLELCISVSNYSSVQINTITRNIFNMMNLVELNIQFKINCIASINIDLSKLSKLKKLVSLQLDLQHCKITDQMASVIGYQLRQLKELIILDLNLSFNEIGNDGFRKLLDGLKVLERLKLNLNFNHISDQGIKYLQQYLSIALKQKKPITEIEVDLQNNKLTLKGNQTLIASQNQLTKFQLNQLYENTFKKNEAQFLNTLHVKEILSDQNDDYLSILNVIFQHQQYPKSINSIYQIFSAEQKVNLIDNKMYAFFKSSVQTYLKNNRRYYFDYLYNNYYIYSQNKKIYEVEISISYDYHDDYTNPFNKLIKYFQDLRFLKINIIRDYESEYDRRYYIIREFKLMQMKRLVYFKILYQY